MAISSGSAAPPEGLFERHDLKIKLYSSGSPFYRWNRFSDLRLLPFSIVPKSVDAPLKIGAMENQNSLMFFGLEPNTHFAGKLDSVRIWKRVRSDNEIRANWNQKLTGTEAGLLKYYRFDEGKGEQILQFNQKNDPNPGSFGGANQIFNARMWKTARTPADILANKDQSIEDLGLTEEEKVDLLYFPLEDEKVSIAPAIIDDQFAFTLEATVKIDTFVLSGEEHYLIFKRDSWALLLFQEEHELYFAFTYDFRRNYFAEPWHRIEAHQTPLSQVKSAHIAVVGNWNNGRGTIRLYINGIERETRDHNGQTTTYISGAKTIATPLDLLEMRLNDNKVSIGEEGKPKWAASSLLLMDGLQFDGNDQVTLPEVSTNFNQGISMEAWVFLDDDHSGDWWPILHLNDDADHVLALSVNKDSSGKGMLHFTIKADRGSGLERISYSSVAIIDTNRWVHVAVTLRKEVARLPVAGTDQTTQHFYTQICLFVNGVKAFQAPEVVDPNSPLFFPPSESRPNCYIGKSTVDGADVFFKGKIDEVRLWRIGRLPEQIKGYMRQELPEEHEHLAGLWKFSEGSGIAAYDLTKNGYHGLLGALPKDLASAPNTTKPSWVVQTEKVNSGLQFSGTGDALLFENLDWGDDTFDALATPTDVYTIELWLKYQPTFFTNGAQHGDIITLTYEDTDQPLQIRGTSDLKLELTDGTNTVSFTDVLVADKWVHLALTFDRATAEVQLYRHVENQADGQSFDAQPFNNIQPVNLLTRAVFGGGFSGSMDEVRLWTAARDNRSVDANLFAKLNPIQYHPDPTDPTRITAKPLLLAYWPMNENGGQRITDKTPLRNHGNLQKQQATIPNKSEPTNPINVDCPRWIETSDIQFDGYLFDGRSEFVEIPYHRNLDLTNDFSITAWIEPNRFFGLQGILTKVTDVDEAQFALSMDGDILRFDYEKRGNNYTLTGGKIKDGWNHVAVTVKSRTFDLMDLLNDDGQTLLQSVTYENTTGVEKDLRGVTDVAKDANILNITTLKVPLGYKALVQYEAPPDTPDQHRFIIDTYYNGHHAVAASKTQTLDDGTVFHYTLKRISTDFHIVKKQVRLPKIHLYINGLLVNSGVAFEETQRNGFALNIGAWGGKIRSHHFHGTIDVVVLWNKALSQNEILTNKDVRLPSITDLTERAVAGYWSLNETIKTTGIPNGPFQYGTGYLGRYDRAKDMFLYRHRVSRSFNGDGRIQVLGKDPILGTPSKINLGGAAITFEYWFKGRVLGAIFRQSSGTDEIWAGIQVVNEIPTLGLKMADTNPTIDGRPYEQKLAAKLQDEVQDGRWHHIAISWEQNKENGLAVFVDGQQLQVPLSETDQEPMVIKTSAKAIPNFNTMAFIGESMIGEIAELRIWGVARPLSIIRRDQHLILNKGRESTTNLRLKLEEPGLIAYWPLNDTATDNLLEYSAFHFDGLALKAPPNLDSDLSLLSKEGGVTLNALQLNGENDFISIPAVPGINLAADFTIEMWIQLAEDFDSGPLLSRGDFRDPSLPLPWKTIFIRDQRVYFGFYAPWKEWIEVPFPIIEELFVGLGKDWHHLALQFDSNRVILTLTLDAKISKSIILEELFIDPDLMLVDNQPALDFKVGIGRMDADLKADPQYFKGMIGEVRMWNKKLPLGELIRNKKRALFGTESGIEGLWRFIEKDGQSVPDLTAESTSAEITGCDWIVNSGFDLDGLEDVTENTFITEKGILSADCLQLSQTKLNLGNSALLKLDQHFSFECWIYLDAIPASEQVIITKGPDGEFELAVHGRQIIYRHKGFEQRYDIPDSVLLAANWYHVALVREAGINLVRFYLNSKLQVNFSATVKGVRKGDDEDKLYNGAEPVKTNNDALVGMDHNGGRAFTGRLADLRIWETTLNAQDIKLFMDRRLRGSEEGLVSYLPLANNPNELDEGDSKAIRITLLHKAFPGRTFTGSASVSAVDEEGLVINEGARIEIHHIIQESTRSKPSVGTYVEYTIKVTALSDSSRVNNFSKIQLTTDLEAIFGGSSEWELVSVKALPSANGQFTVHAGFNGLAATSGNHVQTLLGIADFSLNEKHPVLENGSFIPIHQGLNNLEPASSIKINVWLEIKAPGEASKTPDAFVNLVSGHFIKASGDHLFDGLITADFNGDIIEPRLSVHLQDVQLVASTGETVAITNADINHFFVYYQIQVTNQLQSQLEGGTEEINRLRDIEITDQVGAIFDSEFLEKDNGNSWSIARYEVADLESSPAFYLNPVFNGESENQLCGLQLIAPEPVLEPPTALVEIDQKQKNLVAQTGHLGGKPKTGSPTAQSLTTRSLSLLPAANESRVLNLMGIAKLQSPDQNIPTLPSIGPLVPIVSINTPKLGLDSVDFNINKSYFVGVDGKNEMLAFKKNEDGTLTPIDNKLPAGYKGELSLRVDLPGDIPIDDRFSNKIEVSGRTPGGATVEAIAQAPIARVQIILQNQHHKILSNGEYYSVFELLVSNNGEIDVENVNLSRSALEALFTPHTAHILQWSSDVFRLREIMTDDVTEVFNPGNELKSGHWGRLWIHAQISGGGTPNIGSSSQLPLTFQTTADTATLQYAEWIA